MSEHTSVGRRPVHSLSYSVWNLSNNILTHVKQIGVLLENSTGARGEEIKELPYKSSRILGFGKGLCLWQILDRAHSALESLRREDP